MILLMFLVIALLAFVGLIISRNHRQMNTICMVHSLVFALISVWLILSGKIPITSLAFGSPYFFIDHLGIYEVLICTVIFTCAAVYARGYVDGLLESGELEKGSLRVFYLALTSLLLVMVLTFFAENLAIFWICAELTTIISALLVAILSTRENISAAIKYIFIASTSMLFSFVGITLLFEISRSVTGTGTLSWTALLLQAHSFPTGMMTAVFVLVFIGFAAKSGIFPFHTWLPEAHAKSPSAVSAILSGVLLNVGIYGIIRIYAIVHQTPSLGTASSLLVLFGMLTIGIAAFSMIPEKNLKKLIAFSSVENMGILLIGLAVATPVAIFWVLFHIMAHSFTKASLFFSAGILHRQYRNPLSNEVDDDICNVFRYQPLAAWGIIIGGIAITGMPPFPIFWSKLFILLQVGTVSPLALFAMLFLIFIAAVAFGYFVLTTFTKSSEPDKATDIIRFPTPIGMKLPIILLLLLIFITGVAFTTGEVSFITAIQNELMFS